MATRHGPLPAHRAESQSYQRQRKQSNDLRRSVVVQDPTVDHALPNPDAHATALEQHPPQREEWKPLSIYRMRLAIKPTLGEMLTYSCILFSIERKTIQLV